MAGLPRFADTRRTAKASACRCCSSNRVFAAAWPEAGRDSVRYCCRFPALDAGPAGAERGAAECRHSAGRRPIAADRPPLAQYQRKRDPRSGHMAEEIVCRRKEFFVEATLAGECSRIAEQADPSGNLEFGIDDDAGRYQGCTARHAVRVARLLRHSRCRCWWRVICCVFAASRWPCWRPRRRAKTPPTACSRARAMPVGSISASPSQPTATTGY